MTTAGPDGGAPTSEPDRHGRLLGIALRTLVRDHVGSEPGPTSSFPGGAALVHDDAAWVLFDSAVPARLGTALVWAVRRGAACLHVVAGNGAGDLARRAAEFAYQIDVWRAEGRALFPVTPDRLAPPLAASAEHLALREQIAAGGADPRVEHGVVFGEVRGLEVCRVVDDPDGGGPRLDVGVGVHDREAFAVLHGLVPTVESLARIVEAVRRHRSVGADQHPLNRLARERFLRWRLERDPSLVGAARLRAAEPPVARVNVGDPVPCVARGVDAGGRAMTVVCSAGVDVDLVPYAADARLAAALAAGTGTGEVGEQRLVVAVPARDRLPLLDEVAGLLAQLAGWSSLEVVSVEPASVESTSVDDASMD